MSGSKIRRKKTISTYQDFDIVRFLQDNNIPFSEGGRNVGRDWLGIEVCPFCGADNNHCGINQQTKSFNCFVCGKTGLLPLFIHETLNLSWNEVYKKINEYSDQVQEITFRESGDKVIFPKPITEEMPKLANQYLEKRGFDPEFLHNEYNLKYTLGDAFLKVGKDYSNFSYRIIIPIYMNNILVSYTGRDYTGHREPRYMNPLLDACIIPPTSAIYGYDNIKKGGKAIFVEGYTDAWKMRGETVSTGGKVITKEQIRYIAEKDLELAVILFDEDAEKEADKFANNLTGVVKRIIVSTLEGVKDPGMLCYAEATLIRTKLLES